jgi:hypothetical protein
MTRLIYSLISLPLLLVGAVLCGVYYIDQEASRTN